MRRCLPCPPQTNTAQAEVLYRLVAEVAGALWSGRAAAAALVSRRSCVGACPCRHTCCRSSMPCFRYTFLHAELRPSDIVLDLYCGTGSIGLSLAATCAQVSSSHAGWPMLLAFTRALIEGPRNALKC